MVLVLQGTRQYIYPEKERITSLEVWKTPLNFSGRAAASVGTYLTNGQKCDHWALVAETSKWYYVVQFAGSLNGKTVFIERFTAWGNVKKSIREGAGGGDGEVSKVGKTHKTSKDISDLISFAKHKLNHSYNVAINNCQAICHQILDAFTSEYRAPDTFSLRTIMGGLSGSYEMQQAANRGALVITCSIQ